MTLMRWTNPFSRRRCPVCGASPRHFLPLSSFYDEEARKHGFPYGLDAFETLNVAEYSCPRCKCSDRDRLYALFLHAAIKQRVQAGRKVRVLDIAPAEALSRRLKAMPDVEYRSADLYMPGVDDRVSLTNMPCYEDGRFDIAICSHVLEHIHDDRAAMRELFRVMAAGGQAIVMVPLARTLAATQYDPAVDSDAERWRRYGQNDHVRLYSRGDFLARLADAGFEVSALGLNHFGEKRMRQHGITSGSVLYVAAKPGAATTRPKA